MESLLLYQSVKCVLEQMCIRNPENLLKAPFLVNYNGRTVQAPIDMFISKEHYRLLISQFYQRFPIQSDSKYTVWSENSTWYYSFDSSTFNSSTSPVTYSAQVYTFSTKKGRKSGRKEGRI